MKNIIKKEAYRILLNVDSGKMSAEEAQTELIVLMKTPQQPVLQDDKRIYTGEEMRECKFGIYEIFWANATRNSIAAIGGTDGGGRWVAPTNWTTEDSQDPTGRLDELDIVKIILLFTRDEIETSSTEEISVTTLKRTRNTEGSPYDLGNSVAARLRRGN